MIKMVRDIELIASELNRAKTQLASLERSQVFQESEREVLRPKWKETIKKLQNEYDTKLAENIEVNKPTSETGI